jgi:hypothetical protein
MTSLTDSSFAMNAKRFGWNPIRRRSISIPMPRIPICQKALWGSQSRWANWDDCAQLGWLDYINPQLDIRSDKGSV